MAVHRFTAVLGGQAGERPLVEVPAEILAELGGRGRIPVAGSVNGTLFRSSTMPIGGGRQCVGFRQEIRDAAGIAIGDSVEVVIARDDAPRTVEVPGDLAAALDAAAVRPAFDALSYTHRREHVEAVLDAKKPDTRDRRIAQVVAAVKDVTREAA
jgi:bifunctional DNA-binding transcriptional regulator/antitoxin component of YhaV-PrlF toxin-antitoxin module